MGPVGMAASLLALVDWKKVLRSVATDSAGKGAKGLLGRLKPDERERAARQALGFFVDEFVGEIEDKTPLSSAVAGYRDQLKRLIEHAAPDITGWLQPETKDVDLGPVERMWTGLGLDRLPEDFDWGLVAKNYARDIRRYVKGDPELRERLNTALLEKQAELQAEHAKTLERMAGVDFGFDLTGYRDYLRKKCGVLQLGAMHTSTYDRRISLWSIFIPQSARESVPVRDIPRELLRQMRREGQITSERDENEIKQWRRLFESSPVNPILDIIKRERLVVVLGDPGSGKTSLLKYLAIGWANEEPDESSMLPVWIDLKEYAQQREGLLEYCESGRSTFRLDGRTLDELLKTGKAAFYLDGLDEIFEGGTRGSVIEKIAGFAARYPQAHVVVTSRIVGYEPDRLGNAGFTHVTLEDFDNKQVSSFIAKWHEAAEDDLKERSRLEGQLNRALKESKAVRELAGNPLLVTMMAILNRTQALPRDRVELYQQASRVLLHEWDASRSLPVDTFGRQEKEGLLRELAGAMQQQEGGLAGNLIDRTRLLDIFRSYLKNLGVSDPYEKAVSLVNQLTERNFILAFAGADRFSFVHRTFLEYFCAAWFVDLFEKKQTLTLEQLKNDVFGAHWNDESWREVLRLITGMVGEKKAGELIRFLMEQCSDNGLADLRLAAECLNEVRNRRAIQETDDALYRKFTERVDRYFDRDREDLSFMSGAEIYRENVAWIVITVWPTEATRVWLVSAARRNSIMFVRAMALESIVRGWKNEPETLEIVKDRACSDDDVTVRWVAAVLLAYNWREDAETVEILKSRVRSEKRTPFRTNILQRLETYWPDDPEVKELRVSEERGELGKD